MNFKINNKEKLYLVFMSIVSILLYGLLFYHLKNSSPIAITYSYIITACFGLGMFMSLWFIGYLRGNGVKINRKQFPDVYEILESHSKKLNLKIVPDVYLVQSGGVLNAFATRFAKRDYVILNSSILELAYQEGIDAVSFIIGHELGHIKRNHMGFFKSMFLLPAKAVPFLSNAYSRACEYTCDNIGYSLCPEGALKGALILAAGKKLYNKINMNELMLNIESQKGFATTFAEVFSTHPALIKRIAVINKLDQDNLRPGTNSFVSPKVDIQQTQASQ